MCFYWMTTNCTVFKRLAPSRPFTLPHPFLKALPVFHMENGVFIHMVLIRLHPWRPLSNNYNIKELSTSLHQIPLLASWDQENIHGLRSVSCMYFLSLYVGLQMAQVGKGFSSIDYSVGIPRRDYL